MANFYGRLRELRARADEGDYRGYQRDAQALLYPKGRDHARIIAQVNDEYELCWRTVKSRMDEGLLRLKLYNNQRRDKLRVGDPLLFTTHQTVLAALYYDKLGVEFRGREEGDADKADAMNAISIFDYDEMEKAVLDYFQDWDSLFFGNALVYFNDFDRDSKTPIPVLWDTLTFLRDPRAVSVNGNRLRQGGLRFGGREVFLTKAEMQSNPEYFNINKLRSAGRGGYNNLVAEADRQRREAHGLDDMSHWEAALRENVEYPVLQWLTHINGERWLVELGNEKSCVLRLTPFRDGKLRPARDWPLIERPIYPMPNSWDGVSISDLVEDKQRFRAAMLNVFGDSAKADLYPMYLFDSNKIKKTQDFNFGFNKMIPVNGPVNEGAVMPLRKAQPSAQAQFMLDFLDQATQRALATPEIRQGVPSKDNRTLGEQQLISSGVDTRYSLSARIWGWSERRFWKRHYEIYERDFEDGIDKKAIRLEGAFGEGFRDYKRSDLIATCPLGLDVKIESREISEAQKIRDFNLLTTYLGGALAEPGADRLYGLRKQGRYIMPKDEIERLLPLTVDERQAEKENDQLSRGRYVNVTLEDNHIVHLRVHAAAEDTPALRAHIEAHEEAILMKRVALPGVFPIMPEDILPEDPNSALADQATQRVGQQGNLPTAGMTGMATTPPR